MIHHVQLGAPAGSEPAARAFWVGLVGLEEIPKPPWDDAFSGVRRFYTTDPFGNRLELLEHVEP